MQLWTSDARGAEGTVVLTLLRFVHIPRLFALCNSPGPFHCLYLEHMGDSQPPELVHVTIERSRRFGVPPTSSGHRVGFRWSETSWRIFWI